MKKIFYPTVQQMRLFDSVARHGSITRAAEEVNLTQPSVSMQIKAMEAKIGIPLTEQMGKTIYLTRAGEIVAATSRDVLGRLTEMQHDLEDMQRDVTGPISVAVVSTAKYFLPQLLGAFKRRYPNVDPRLQITNRKKLITRIMNNADDLYIMGRPPEQEALNASPFLENVIVFVAPPEHPLAKAKTVSLAEIAQENIIGREIGSGTRHAVEKLFRDAGLRLKPHMEFDDSEAIKQGVISGLGIAYLSLHALRLERAAEEIAVLNVEGFPLRRPWYAMHHRGKRLSNAAQAFLEFLQNEGVNELK